MGKRWEALPTYFLLEGSSAFLFQVATTLYVVFYATTGGMDALQIVLVGTVFEVSIFLFEVPTGVVADVYSRRLSITIGVGLIGLSWLVAGLFPTFAVIVLSEVISGIGVTFTSGATEAWISDEIGVEAAGKAFVRASQLKTLVTIAGIVVSIILASAALNLPFIIAGALLLVLALALALRMPEAGFHPVPAEARETWRNLFKTLEAGIGLIRVRRALIPIFCIAFIVAAHGEGYDHLWQKHILDNFSLPVLAEFKPLVWFGAMSLAASLLSLVVSEITRRRINLSDQGAIRHTLLAAYGLAALGMIAFALTANFVLAFALFTLIAALQGAAEPISKAWLNHHTDSSVRATMFSMYGLVGAFGEIAGGPPVGLIAKSSLRGAIASCGAVLALTVPFVIRLVRQPSRG